MDLLLTFAIVIGASLLGSFAGGGASLLMLPLFLWLLGGSYGQSLAAAKVGAAMMVVSAAIIHFHRYKFDWRLLISLIISGFTGTALGTYLVQYQLNEVLFTRLLGCLLLLLTAYLVFLKPQLGTSNQQTKKIDTKLLLISAAYSLLINVLNGLFGGTGILLTLYLVLFIRLSFIEAVAYSLVNYVPINIAQATYLGIAENLAFPVILTILIAAFAGGRLGTNLQYLKGNKWVRLASIALMLVLGIRALFFS